MFDFCDFFGFSSGFFALERSFNSTGSVFLGSIITCRVSSEAKDGVAGLFDASGTKVSESRGVLTAQAQREERTTFLKQP